jgi:hypothetical protein
MREEIFREGHVEGSKSSKCEVRAIDLVGEVLVVGVGLRISVPFRTVFSARV